MKKFEHKIVVITLINGEAVLEELNNYGQEGWELVNARDFSYIFKREICETQKPRKVYVFKYKHGDEDLYVSAKDNEKVTTNVWDAFGDQDKETLESIADSYLDFKIVEVTL